MPGVDASLIAAIAGVDPLTLAILFIGLTSLGVIWLAGIIVRNLREDRK